MLRLAVPARLGYGQQKKNVGAYVAQAFARKYPDRLTDSQARNARSRAGWLTRADPAHGCPLLRSDWDRLPDFLFRQSRAGPARRDRNERTGRQTLPPDVTEFGPAIQFIRGILRRPP
jgi:hypothetical protein